VLGFGVTVKAQAERSLADTILVSGRYVQHRLAAGAMLGSVPIPHDQVGVLLDGLLVVLIDDEPAVELSPGAIPDPGNRSDESKQHAKVRARTAARLALLARHQLDNDALLDVSSEQGSACAPFSNGERRPDLSTENSAGRRAVELCVKIARAQKDGAVSAPQVARAGPRHRARRGPPRW
jgi:hypothetical protein